MGKKNNIIEINGQRYNASTGALLSSPVSAHPAPHHRRIDDVAKPSAKPAATKPIPVHHASPAKSAKTSVKTRVHEAARPAKRATTRAPQPAKTLMRSAVKKPAPSLKRHTKAHSHTDALVEKPAARLQPKPSAHRLDSERLKHAQHVRKSQLVSRFNDSKPLAAPDPLQETITPATVPVTTIPTPIEPKVVQPLHPTEKLLERALQNATSHLEPAPKKPKRPRFHLARKHARA